MFSKTSSEWLNACQQRKPKSRSDRKQKVGAIALVESCTYHRFSGIKGADDDKTVWKPGKKVDFISSTWKTLIHF